MAWLGNTLMPINHAQNDFKTVPDTEQRGDCKNPGQELLDDVHHSATTFPRRTAVFSTQQNIETGRERARWPRRRFETAVAGLL